MFFKNVLYLIFYILIRSLKEIKSQQSFGRSYKIILNKSIDIQNAGINVIDEFMVRDKVSCLFQCNLHSNCYASTLKTDGSCALYEQLALNYLIDDATMKLYQRIQTVSSIPGVTNGLVNYWPINGDLNDYVGTAELSPGDDSIEVGLGPDRFNNPNSSIYMNTGYYYAPSGIYFTGGPFSICGWVRPLAFNKNSQLLSFGNGMAADNIYLSIATGTIGQPYFGIWKGNVSMKIIGTTSILTIGQWSHICGVYTGSGLIIYINGTSAASASMSGQMNQNVLRTKCYIGRSSWWPNEYDASAYYDDIRIYNRALSQSEVLVNSQFNLH